MALIAVAVMVLVTGIAAVVIYMTRAVPASTPAGTQAGTPSGNLTGNPKVSTPHTHTPSGNVPKTGSGQWIPGTATYYIASEGGPVGADGSKLVAFQSAAVPTAQYNGLVHKHFEIQSVPGKTWKVVDQCPDKACKTFDLFVGTSLTSAHAIPQWEKGNIPIQYRWVT